MLENRRCVMSGDLAWGEFEPATRIAQAAVVTRITAPGAQAPSPTPPKPVKPPPQKKAPPKQAPGKKGLEKGSQLDAISPPAANAAPAPEENQAQAQQQAFEPPPQQAVPFTGAKSRKK